MKLLIIPEDYRIDQFILMPILEKLFKKGLGAKTKVDICRNPVIGGVSEALKQRNCENVIRMYPMVDAFVLVIDRDAEVGRSARAEALELAMQEILRPGQKFFICLSIEELEAWILAGVDLPNQWSWPEIRAERDVKEKYFIPYAEARGLSSSPGGGRALLAKEAASRMSRLLQLCRDDLGVLLQRVGA